METYKVGIIGDFYSGKTTIINQITKNKVSETKVTLGCDFSTVILDNIKVHVWDTAGQERYGVLTSNYLRDINGVIIVHDLTKKNDSDNEFKDIDTWIDKIRDVTKNDEIPIIVAMNKVDKCLSSERTIMYKGCECVYISATTDYDKTRNMFNALIIQMRLQRDKMNKLNLKTSNKIILDQKKKKNKCTCD